MVITATKEYIELELQKQLQFMKFMMVSGSAHDYEEAHQLALDKAQGSETDVKLVGTTHIHETKVKGSFLYNRLSTEGDRLQKEIFPRNWDS